MERAPGAAAPDCAGPAGGPPEQAQHTCLETANSLLSSLHHRRLSGAPRSGGQGGLHISTSLEHRGRPLWGPANPRGWSGAARAHCVRICQLLGCTSGFGFSLSLSQPTPTHLGLRRHTGVRAVPLRALTWGKAGAVQGPARVETRNGFPGRVTDTPPWCWVPSSKHCSPPDPPFLLARR